MTNVYTDHIPSQYILSLPLWHYADIKWQTKETYLILFTLPQSYYIISIITILLISILHIQLTQEQTKLTHDYA